MAIFLFIVFLAAYAYLFVPAPSTPQEIPDVQPVQPQEADTPPVQSDDPIATESAPQPEVAPSGATLKELRLRCKEQGIRWSKAGPNGRHLNKGEMMALLAA